MANNRGATTLKRKRRAANPMREYDALPKELRVWMAGAVLPWRAGSVQAAYGRALARTGDADLALAELDRVQAALVAKDAGRIWGQTHPAADL
ncbi:MAG: DUF6525 family protein [Silicimonas sp.]|nr:DUF6525 family protein [Silicimonas sp.]